MGCGKSSIGRPLAKRLGLKFVDMDTEIERRCGVSVQQFFADRGEEAFRRAQNAMLGGFVTLAAAGMAVAMIVRGWRSLRGLRQLRRSGRS